MRACAHECVMALFDLHNASCLCLCLSLFLSLYLIRSHFLFPKQAANNAMRSVTFSGEHQLFLAYSLSLAVLPESATRHPPFILLALHTLPCTHKCMILRSYVMISEPDLFRSAFLGLFCTTKETRVLGFFLHFKRD